MIDVYICEDELRQRQLIEKYVRAAIMINEYDMELKVTTDNPDQIVNQVRCSDQTGLYFLDIDLHRDKNGFTLAQEIREYDPRGFIVFITFHSEMSYMTFQYKVEALDFILKDDLYHLQQKIHDCMENVIKKYSSISKGAGKTYTIIGKGRKQTIKYEDIMFFETSSNEHKVIVHTKDSNIEFFGKMKDIEETVGKEFIRVHRAYLVNKRNIKEVAYANKNVTLKNGSICPVSYRMLKYVKELL